MSWWDEDEPGELIAVWDSADPLPAPACFDKRDEPDLIIPAGQHPIEGQFWLDGIVKNARIWIPTPDGTKRRPIGIFVFHLELEFHHKKDSPVTLLPDLEFYDEPGINYEGVQGVRRIDLGRRIVERLHVESDHTTQVEQDDEE
jgi:hypothetical protein